ncbi:ABC transporter permease [Streptomyces acidiscabies]|uniref:ABC transporter permease n=1 Tax=Streptomyces acidiscabies TaxID=42234 RepID=A0A0L0K537_9ACTN|nr:ABC transporter permease [Streptomyces acidiscabies]KND33227.1 ABC transporter permease [Streptomyces acidiscabies]
MSAVSTRAGEDRRDRMDSGHTGGGFPGAFASEWTKLWSIRTPYVCLLIGLIVTGIFTFYYGSIARINDKPIQPVGNASVSSAILTQFALVVLAMTMVTSEYSTSSVRTSLLWVPVRHRVQLAKALLGALVGFVTGVLFALLGDALAWWSFRGYATFDLSKVLYQAVAMGIYFALICVMTVGASFALRTAAGAVSVIFFVVSALPSMLVGLGGPVLLAINDYMPQSAGGHFMLNDGDAPYPNAVSLLVVLAWAVAAHVAGVYVLRRRDA